MNTPPFDILLVARNAYQFMSAERGYILRLAVFPALIKLVCYVTGLALGYDDNVLRMALILVPAALVEGWMLSHVVRLIVLGQRWPFRPTGDTEADMMALTPRLRGVMGGLITYALIGLIVSGVLAGVMAMAPQGLDPAAAAEMTTQPWQVGVLMLVMAAGVWGFPLLWLYIPVAAGMDPASYARAVRGLKFSMPMMAVWLLCYLPIAAITIFGVSAILSPFAEGVVPAGARFSVIIVGVVLDTVKALLGTAGITFALMQFYHGPAKGGRP